MNTSVEKLYACKKQKLKNRSLEEQFNRSIVTGRRLIIELADLQFMMIEENQNSKKIQFIQTLYVLTSTIISKIKILEASNDGIKTKTRT